MASFIGSKIRLTASDGVYEGLICSLDRSYNRVSLEKVVCTDSGRHQMGVLHFFKKEIVNIEVLEERKAQKKSVQEDENNGPKILSKKLSPSHLRKLRDVDREKLFLPHGTSSGDERDNKKNIARETGVAENDKNPAPSIGQYSVIDADDESFTQAVEHIKQHTLVGLSASGVNLGRNGKLCWLAFGTSEYRILFDIVTLGEECLRKGLGEILQSHRIQKIIHDCRWLSDLLHHQYHLQLVNVFDTQVAAVIIERAASTSGAFPSYVPGLPTLLFQHLQLHHALVYNPRFKEGSKGNGEMIWEERPASEESLLAIVKNVANLRQLRIVLMEKMLKDFTYGVNIFLDVVRDAPSETNKETMHRLPAAFAEMNIRPSRGRERNSHQYNEHGFFENCHGVMDPLVKYSHDGVWHSGDGTVRPTNVYFERKQSARSSQSRSRSRSLGRESVQKGRDEGESLLQLGSRAKTMDDDARRDKEQTTSPIPPYKEKPSELNLSPENIKSFIASSSPEIKPAVLSDPSLVTFTASGHESRTCWPKIANRLTESRTNSCHTSGDERTVESADEYDIIQTSDRQHSDNISSKITFSKLKTDGTIDTTKSPSTFSPNRGFAEVETSLIEPPEISVVNKPLGRGKVYQELVKSLSSSPQSTPVTSPGGLQNKLPESRLPKVAQASMSSDVSGTENSSSIQNQMTGVIPRSKTDAHGNISMGRGLLKGPPP